jgi:hypothetical protein
MTDQKKTDDLEAVRVVVNALESFQKEDQKRIIRWASEKIGLSKCQDIVEGNANIPPARNTQDSVVKFADIKTFIAEKSPKGFNHFAAAVAYYHHFKAPESERKESIDYKDILEACRTTDFERPKAPKQTLINAYTAGLFDRVGEGSFKLNSVGENLVAMGLPGNEIKKMKNKIKKVEKKLKTKKKN